MDRRGKWIAGGTLALVLVAGGAGLAIASAGDDDQPLTGSALGRATAAAREHTGGGTVVESEVGDDGAAYGVEIRLDDGRVVEVALDADFTVIGSSGDEEGTGAGDDAGGGENGQDD
jgi:hypothetical protein